MRRGRKKEVRKEREWVRKEMGWKGMDVFGRGASARMGGPLGKASWGKRNRWFVNLLLGTAKEKKVTKKTLIKRAPETAAIFCQCAAFLEVRLFLWVFLVLIFTRFLVLKGVFSPDVMEIEIQINTCTHMIVLDLCRPSKTKQPFDEVRTGQNVCTFSKSPKNKTLKGLNKHTLSPEE